MSRKKKWKKTLSVIIAAVTILSSSVAPFSVYAEEMEAQEITYPKLEEVIDQLDADEVVTAKDYEIIAGTEYDVKLDFTNIEIPDEEKVKIVFDEAKNEAGEDFDTEKPDTYKAVYHVEPKNTEHPVYEISRSLIVKEAETVTENVAVSEEKGEETEEEAPSQMEITDNAEGSVPENDHIITEEQIPVEGEDVETEEQIPVEDVETENEIPDMEESSDQIVTLPDTEGGEIPDSDENTVPDDIPEIDNETIIIPEVTLTPETDSGEDIQIETEEGIIGEEILESEELTKETLLEKLDDGCYQVNITKGEEFNIVLSEEDGRYRAGEVVEFTTDIPSGYLVAVAALLVKGNAENTTADIMYSEVTYHPETGKFSFVMPEDDIDLEVAIDYQGGGIMLLAAEDESLWDEATEIEANTYYYYSDGIFHQFNTVMGSGGRDSYKYVRYKVDGKTYTSYAYCLQHSMPSPPRGTTYTSMIELDEKGDDVYLRKALFYGYGGPGWGDTFNGYNIQQIMLDAGCTTEMQSMQHYLVDYLYDGESGFGAALSDTAKTMIKDIKAALKKMPDPIAVELLPSLSVTASGRETETFKWKANAAFTLTIQLEDGVSLVNETTGETGTGAVTVKGGDKFHLKATAKKMSSLNGNYAITSNYPLDFHAMLLQLESSQDVGFGYYTDSSGLALTVDWPEQAELKIVKKDSVTGTKLAGAVYGVYNDAECKELIIKMPATDENGASSVKFEFSEDIVFLKELTAPAGYELSTEAVEVTVKAGEKVTKTLKDNEILGNLKIYKEGEVLTGAETSDSGVSFAYKKQKLAGAIYHVTAAEDIVAADGTIAFKAGDTVAENLETNEDGYAEVSGLHMGTYLVTEVSAPDGYINTGESKKVSVKAGEQGTSVVSEVSFTNERQKAEVTAIKKDAESETFLAGAVFGLYAGSDIKNVDGTVIVENDTLIAKAETGSDGYGGFTADLPIGHDYYMKELEAPEGFLLNTEDIYCFRFSYTTEKEVTQKFVHTFTNGQVKGSLIIYKEGEELVSAESTEEGTVFHYELRKQQGAVYDVYAGAEIRTAAGKTVYQKGDLVAENLTTGENGSVTLDGLYFGTYVVKEKKAPEGLVCKNETEEVTLSYDAPDVEAVMEKVSFTNERQRASVTVVKQDEESEILLGGAVFGLYADSDIKNVDGAVIVKKDTLLAKAETGSDGHGSFQTDLPIGNAFYMKELKAPEGFLLNTADIYRFSFSYTTDQEVLQKFTHTFSNGQVKGSLTIYKEGEELVSADIKDTGTAFGYELRKQQGAVYDVYAGAEIRTAAGKTVYQKGDLVAKDLVTDETGNVTLNDLYLGAYIVKEKKAPQDLVCTGESKEVVLSLEDMDAEMVMEKVSFTNERQKASVTVKKVDSETKNPLQGGIYGLYAAEDIKNTDANVIVPKDTFIEKVVTGKNGKASFTADIPISFSYYMKEIQAPDGYIRNTEETGRFTFTYTKDTEAVVEFNHTFENEPVTAKIDLIKEDKETVNSQGDAVLEGAVYGLYTREDILHPDGSGTVLYEAGVQVASLTTDAEGKASVDGLSLGNYYMKETTPSVGYLLDETEYDISCTFENDLTEVVEYSVISKEQVMKQPFQIIKAVNNGETDAELLSGAGFTAYLVSDLKVKEDGTYDFASAQPVELGKNGTTEIFTNEKGYVVSIALPYGTYVVRETTTPHNYKPVDDFIVRISENRPTEPQVWRVLLDEEFSAKLKVIKQDDETKKTVLSAGTEFKIYDVANERYVEQVTTYPVTTIHTSFFTDSAGYLILPQHLRPGQYRIEEVTAPEGYTLNPEHVEITIDSDSLYQIDSVSGDAVIEAVYEDHPVKGELTVIKKGEVLSSYKDDFVYEVRELAGAVFEVYAAEDIYTADFQKDAEGNRILEYAKDTLIATLTTDENGTAVLGGLPLGTYKVVEKTAPEGYILNEQEQIIEFAYEGQEVPVVEAVVEFINERQKVELSSVKKDSENDSTVAGAEFGLYAKEDIYAGETLVVEKDALLETVVSGEDGRVVFTQALPFGKYYVKESKAPKGYVSSDEILEFDAVYQGQDILKAAYEAVMKNDPTTVELTKADVTTGAELDGASLTVMDKDGNVIDSWTSVKDKPHVIKRLTAGETYTLREEFAPYGYLKATDIQFTVEDTGEVQKVEMKDEVPTAHLIINKKGEFLEHISLLDGALGSIEHFFEYVSGELKEVAFEVYAAEDIKAADGVSEDYYKKDELVITITTDDNGIAQAEGLPVGKYYVKEAETAYGYILDDEIRYVDLSYRDQDTSVVVYSEDWQNNRQKVQVQVVKKEVGTDRVLEGAVFGLFAKEDILSTSGEVLLMADTLIEQKATDGAGTLQFLADLPIDGTYYVKELEAPDGFVTNEEIQEFTFAYEGNDVLSVTYEFTFENEPTTVELTKADLTTGDELPGAHLEVTDKDGNIIDEWISTEEPHIIKELTVGETYTMTETKPADGYVTAESIVFTVEDTAEIQKHEMLDDVTKVQISKVDMTDGSSEVKGAKLYILNEEKEVIEHWISGEEPHYIEKLPVGTYTLLEEAAPKGYIISNSVEFEVLDTGEVQSLMMKDDHAVGKLILNKTDKESGEPMKGVEFTLYDNKGNVLETLVTDSAGHAESNEYPIATFTDGKYGETLTYILKETKTLEGYVLDETEHEITFVYVDDKTPVIEVTLELTNEEVKKEAEEDVPEDYEFHTTEAPKTGDETNIALFVVLFLVSLLGLAGVVVKRRKMNH